MGGFKAQGAVSSLDFDFEPYVEGAKGTIAEPSQDALDRYRDANESAMAQSGLSLNQIAEVVKLASGDTEPSEDEMVRVLGHMPDDLEAVMAKAREAQAAQFETAIEVCGGTPSEEQIKALPGRVREAFVGWLTGELLRPTRPTPASRPSPAGVNGASGATS